MWDSLDCIIVLAIVEMSIIISSRNRMVLILEFLQLLQYALERRF